jgi:streptomycin 6-kinase
MATIEVNDELRAAATYFGAVGERWLDELPAVVASLEAEWGISTGRTLTGGNFAYVAEVVTAEGEPAVLKVAVPRGATAFTQELRTLQLAQGDPYAGLIRFDEERRSLLLERLGRQMAELGWPVDRQLAAITETVARGWRPVNGDGLADGATKARWLADYIPRAWESLGKPCAEQCIERAVEYARERARWLDGRTPVLIHGDAHPWNVLELPGGGDTPGEGQQFRLIDPEGLASEPAHDLGVILRGWNDELLEVGGDVAVVTFERCASVGLRTGVDPEGTWRWSFIERVSSGLLLQELGHDADARSFLAVADRLVDAKSPWS